LPQQHQLPIAMHRQAGCGACLRFGGSKVRQEAGAISRWKSGPGKVQQAAWKRVLREPTATPATKRTRLLHGVCVIEPRNRLLAGAEIVFAIDRNMGNAVKQGAARPAGVEEHITCKKERVLFLYGRPLHDLSERSIARNPSFWRNNYFGNQQ